MKYYVVHTNAGSELIAETSLVRAGYETFYPHYPGLITHGRKRIGVIKPLFPRYLFIGVHEGQGMYDANKAIGVATVLHDAVGPFEISRSIIDDIMAQCDKHGRINEPAAKQGQVRNAPRFEVGSQVVVNDGPLKGMPGIVESDDGVSREVTITITMMGKFMIARIWASDLKLSSANRA